MTGLGPRRYNAPAIESEVEQGKAAFIELVRGMDPDVQCVIPTVSSNNLFLIGLAKGKTKQFLSLSEDDVLDLPANADVREEVVAKIRKALAGLGG